MNTIYYIPIENNFIHEFVEHFFNEPKKDYSDTAIIFPNKRPFLFLNKEISQKLGSSFISFKEFTVDEFVQYIAEKTNPEIKRINKFDAIWIIYKMVQERKIEWQGEVQKFEEFIPWGQRIYSLIDQMDIENIDTAKLKAIEENAEIGYNIPEQINNLLESIAYIREEFHNILEREKIWTRGYIYLKALENIDNINLDEFNTIYFAGIFALTKVEESIIKKLLEQDKAKIILNGKIDNWEILKNIWGNGKYNIEQIGNDYKNKSPLIKLHSAFDLHSETIEAFNILTNIEIKNCAVVLPVSDTLFPFLSFTINRLKAQNKITNFNISLRYPLIRTSLFSLIKNIIEIQKFTKLKNNVLYYNTSQYIKIITNPFIKNISYRDNPNVTREFVNTIIRILQGNDKNYYDKNLSERGFIRLKDIKDSPVLSEKLGKLNITNFLDKIDELHKKIFINFESVQTLKQLSENIEEFLKFILINSEIHSYILSGELFNILFETVNDLKKLKFANETFDKELIFNIFLEYLQQQDIAFSTTPLQDLEIIGMLETRNLNFDNVIIMDVQDNVIPGEKRIDPLIPLDFYKYLELPTYEMQEEMNRYYFTRLIKSAKNVHLLFVEDEEKQRSRYIEKLIWEREKKELENNKSEKKLGEIFPIKKINLPINFIDIKEDKLYVDKDDKIIKKLKEMSYSPSAIDTYISCGVRFYLQYILNLNEEKQISEDVESSEIGTLIHSILSNTYEKAKKVKNYFDKSRIKEMQNILIETTEETFRDKPNTGKYYILKKIITERLKQFISEDLKERNFSLYGVELKLEGEHTINNNIIKLKGYIDRIDKIGDTFLIIDYKTGNSDKFKNVGKINIETDSITVEDLISNEVTTLQLPIYIKLFLDNNKGVSINNIEAEYIFLKDKSGKIQTLFNEEKLSKENTTKEGFFKLNLQILEIVLLDMLDKDKPFRKYEDTNCKNCPFLNNERCILSNLY